MKFNVRRIGRPLFESFLIVFSVLFALFVNRCAEDQRTEERKKIALGRIQEELRGNQELITNVLVIHKKALSNLQRAAADSDDSLRLYLSARRYVDADFFALFVGGKGSFYPRAPSNTSWNAAKSTGVITEFDYLIVDLLTAAYDTQEVFQESTVSSITDLMFSPISDNELDMIMALSTRIQELISQEENTLTYIKEALHVLSSQKVDTE